MKKYFALLLIFISLNSVLLSCTTSEDDTESSEIEEELNSELDDMDNNTSSEVADGDLEDLDDANFEGEDVSDVDLEAADKSPNDSKEEDDFFAEDSPATNPNSTALAENDLKQELQAPVAPVPPTPAYPEEIPPALPPDGAPSNTVTSRETMPRLEDFENVSPMPDIPKDDLGVSDPLVADVDPQLPSVRAAKEVVPISKIGKDPFFRNERLMNTVYIARPGDDLGTISQKIFNEDRTSQLLADNPHISKGIEPGDKVYYNSLNRPEDKKAILTFYEDSRFATQYYTTKQGDDIRRIGQQLLGFADAWKEVWAVNESLQTQSMLPSGLKLKYWTGNELRETSVAKGAVAPSETVEPTPEPRQEPEVPINLAGNDLPTATPSINTEDPALSAGITEPAPTLSESTVPTTPAVKPQDSSTTTVAAIALIVIAALVLVAIQIKNRRKDNGAVPPSLEFTKV